MDQRRRERRAAVDAEVELEREHVSRAASCLPPLIPLVLVNLWAVFSPLHQTLWERLAGTIAVED